MLKRKPSFATYWLPIAAVSFAPLMFPGVASAAVPSAPQRPQKTQLVPTDAKVPAQTNQDSDEPGFIPSSQMTKAFPQFILSASGNVLTVHGTMPAACDGDLSIRSSMNDSQDIKTASNVGGVAFYNNGHLLTCISDHAEDCQSNVAIVAGKCEKLSSRSDAKYRLPNQTATYDYLNVSFRDDVTNADPAGLASIRMMSSEDHDALLRTAVIADIKSCIKDKRFNDADEIMNNNVTLLSGVVDDLKSEVQAGEDIATSADAAKLAHRVATDADEKNDFDYGSETGDILDFLDAHPDQGDKFAAVLKEISDRHTKIGNATSSDVSETKDVLERALDSDYKYSKENQQKLESLLKEMPLRAKAAELEGDEERMQKGGFSGAFAMQKFIRGYSKDMASLQKEYVSRCANSDKADSQSCQDLSTQLTEMAQMPQQVNMQLRQNAIAQQQAMATVQQAMYGGGMQQQQPAFGVQQNPACTYNPSACMQVGGGGYAGMNGQMNPQPFSPTGYSVGANALQASMIPSMQASSMPLLQAGYNGIPVVNQATMLPH